MIGTRRLHEIAWRARSGLSGLTGGWRWRCSSCGFHGSFVPAGGRDARRPHARCPKCGAVERHRLQMLVLDELLSTRVATNEAAIHFAPEPYVSRRLKAAFSNYTTADLVVPDVDVKADLTALQFDDASFDVLWASHVLEHIPDDAAAIREIYRVLRPGGVAVLPVPIVVPETIEYGAPNPKEFDHVRAPGVDYFDRYRSVFDRVEVRTSFDYPLEHQLLLFEDRSIFPTADRPLRTPMGIGPHPDHVPLCYKD